MSVPTAEEAPCADRSRWFAEKVQPHESSLRSYLRGNFPAMGDIDDVVQESYVRIWRTRMAQPIDSAKAFLFKVARHLALDHVRRARISPIVAVTDLAALAVIADRPGPAEAACTREEVLLLADAIEALPPRCRAIVILRKLQGLPQKEIAARLGLSEQTVQVQVCRGVKRCEEYLRRRGLDHGSASL